MVGVLKNGSGPALMLRTDLDALPVAEQTGPALRLEGPHARRTRGDGRRDARLRPRLAHGQPGRRRPLPGHAPRSWAGTVVFIGQPAEERGAGAEAMLDDGLFTRFPRPDFAVALHDAADMPAGKVGYHAGYAQANVDSVDITIKGRGGHGAYPETTIDPIVIAARLVLDLQTIVSREVKPTDPAVITVGSIHGGTQAQHHRRRVQAATDGAQLFARRPRSSCRRRFAAKPWPRRPAPCAGAGGRPSPKARRRCTTIRHLRTESSKALRRELGEDERERGGAVDGRRGFQPLRAGRRADLHVQAGRGESDRGSTSTTPARSRPPRCTRRCFTPMPRPGSASASKR